MLPGTIPPPSTRSSSLMFVGWRFPVSPVIEMFFSRVALVVWGLGVVGVFVWVFVAGVAVDVLCAAPAPPGRLGFIVTSSKELYCPHDGHRPSQRGSSWAQFAHIYFVFICCLSFFWRVDWMG